MKSGRKIKIRSTEAPDDGLMKLAIVSPRFPFSGRVPQVPQILDYLAVLTQSEAPNVEIALIVANQQEFSPTDHVSEIVAISVITATAPWHIVLTDMTIYGVGILIEVSGYLTDLHRGQDSVT